MNSMDEQTRQQWLESLWADREERLYRQFFGDLGRGIFTLTPETFEQMGRRDPDPRWLFHGVFECPPTAARPHWIYVTSGMSNPWGESPETIKPDAFSGLGFEFTVHAKEPSRWAIDLLHWLMAVQLLAACGQLKGGLIEYNDRVRFRPATEGKASAINTLLIATPPAPGAPGGYPAQFHLASGKVDLMLAVGISEREADFARTQDPEALIRLLRHHEIYPLTDLNRITVV